MSVNGCEVSVSKSATEREIESYHGRLKLEQQVSLDLNNPSPR